MPTNIDEVRDFLGAKRIALVGLSRNPKHFSRTLFRDMCKRGYDMVPVNPAASELETERCFPRVQDIDPPVDAVLVMTPASETGMIVRDCAEAGVRRMWMYRAGGQGAVSPAAVDFCHKEGIHLVEGLCPYMFFPHTPFFHRIHGFMLKLTGGYPRDLRPSAH
ncbi:MAG TPA: CoA-binding protein [Terriglobales bacterium]|nr:CoA-binding protein [Terriglobales bacterium]